MKHRRLTERVHEFLVVGDDNLRVDQHRKASLRRMVRTTAPAQSRMATASPPRASLSKKLLGSSSTQIYAPISRCKPNLTAKGVRTCGLFHKQAAMTSLIF